MTAIDSLSELCPPPKPAFLPIPDPAECSMEKIFAPLRQQWVWDFVFESINQEVDMLQYAIYDNFVVLCEFDVTTHATPDPYASNFRVGEKHRILVLPSFTTGALSVCFGVNERVTSGSSFICRERHTARIVRDDRNCTILSISEDYNIDLVEVSFFSFCSPTQREHRFMIFNRNKFREAIATIRTDYNQKAFKDALVFQFHSLDARHCPNCGRGNCACQLAITPKRHPLDRESEIINLSSYAGRYDGVASLGLYTNGENVFLAQYSTTSGLGLNADFSTQQKLACWAISSAVQRGPINPVKLIMPEADELNNKVGTATETFLRTSLAQEVVDEEARHGALTSVSNMVSAATPGSGVEMGSALAQMSAMPGLGGFDVNSMFGDECELTTGGDLDFIPVVEELDKEFVGSDPVATVSSKSGNTIPAVTSGVNVPRRCVSGSEHGAQPSQAIPLQCIPSQPVPQQAPLSHPKAVMVALPGPNQTTTRPLLPLAPAARKEGDQGGKVSAELDERRRKAERRRARNRESAQKSNLKRKMQIEKLKEEIDAASTRESYLRAKEKMLREENLSLRSAIFR